MCTTCGCGHGETRVDGAVLDHGHEHEHPHAHAHPHDHGDGDGDGHDHDHHHGHGHEHEHRHGHEHGDAPGHASSGWRRRFGSAGTGTPRPLGAAHDAAMPAARIVQIEQDILARNDLHAAANRQTFADRGIFALNLVSSPGSGKTSLLVRTIEALQGRLPVCVIEGDQQTSLDADRIRATGARAVQINTGKGCHLDAHMVGHALGELEPPVGALVLIENVGNLVCPAAFDLGEAHKVVILSVTEGDDKPLKYPDMFRAADLLLLNKVDLLPYVAFDADAAIANARRMRPDLPALCVSATTGAGLAQWLAWIEQGSAAARAARDADVAGLRRRVAELEAMLAGATSAA